MKPSCHFSSTKHTPSLPQQYSFISKNTSPFFSSKTHITKSEVLHVNSAPNPSFATLRIKNYRLQHPFATLAEAGGGEEQNEEIQLSEQYAKPKTQKAHDDGDELSGIAKAFNISPKAASAISICMALAALTFPFFMASMGQALTLKTKFLTYATLLLGLYMAWNIGANDVANAMGTSVGSGALTLRQAVLTAAVLEFSGALLMGSHVTSTMQKGLLVSEAFQGKDTLLLAGLLSSLAAAGTWLQVNY